MHDKKIKEEFDPSSYTKITETFPKKKLFLFFPHADVVPPNGAVVLHHTFAKRERERASGEAKEQWLRQLPQN